MKLKELFEATGKSVADLGIEYKGGDFDCYNNELTSLEGAPDHVGGDFDCDNNELTSLEGAPDHVGGSFSCHHNQLTSLKGAPSHVGVDFSCSNNQLASLQGAPCRVVGDFYCTSNRLTSLKDVHRHISELHGDFHGYSNPLKSNVLGLLLIKGLKRVLLDNMQVQNILNKHLGKGRVGMLQAQEELIEAGLEEFAQL